MDMVLDEAKRKVRSWLKSWKVRDGVPKGMDAWKEVRLALRIASNLRLLIGFFVAGLLPDGLGCASPQKRTPTTRNDATRRIRSQSTRTESQTARKRTRLEDSRTLFDDVAIARRRVLQEVARGAVYLVDPRSEFRTSRRMVSLSFPLSLTQC